MGARQLRLDVAAAQAAGQPEADALAEENERLVSERIVPACIHPRAPLPLSPPLSLSHTLGHANARAQVLHLVNAQMELAQVGGAGRGWCACGVPLARPMRASSVRSGWRERRGTRRVALAAPRLP
jgi:hypothetical protein